MLDLYHRVLCIANIAQIALGLVSRTLRLFSIVP